jgi:hypothetical protein
VKASIARSVRITPSTAETQQARSRSVTAQSTEIAGEAPRWLLLIHQIPPTPNYLRVKIGRRLARIGAVALKSTVYVLPRNEAAQEDFEWVRREVAGVGGEAVLLAAHLLDGLSDRDVEALFCVARDSDYTVIAAEARELQERITAESSPTDQRRQFESEIVRLERRMEEIMSIDFFDAAGREPTRGLVASVRTSITPPAKRKSESKPSAPTAMLGRAWVTRTGIKVDRIGSAWLIRRFIDPAARFKFVQAKGYVPEPDELRFDMFEAEYTHEGDMCTFEVLCSQFGLNARGLAQVAELVHDIDLKDAKFGRPETAGLAAQIQGLTALHDDDETRLARGSELFDELLAHFAKLRD